MTMENLDIKYKNRMVIHSGNILRVAFAYTGVTLSH
jgi:hypothetical protein